VAYPKKGKGGGRFANLPRKKKGNGNSSQKQGVFFFWESKGCATRKADTKKKEGGRFPPWGKGKVSINPDGGMVETKKKKKELTFKKKRGKKKKKKKKKNAGEERWQWLRLEEKGGTPPSLLYGEKKAGENLERVSSTINQRGIWIPFYQGGEKKKDERRTTEWIFCGVGLEKKGRTAYGGGKNWKFPKGGGLSGGKERKKKKGGGMFHRFKGGKKRRTSSLGEEGRGWGKKKTNPDLQKRMAS